MSNEFYSVQAIMAMLAQFANDPSMVDAFGRLRVSNPTSRFYSNFLLDTQPEYWYHGGWSGGTTSYDSTNRLVRLNITAVNQSAYSQTRQFIRYQPGKSQEIMMSFQMAAFVAGMSQGCGYYDEEDGNGITYEAIGATPTCSFNIYNNGNVHDTANQVDWNMDKLDGSLGALNPSGLTLLPGKSQIFYIDLEHLGVGTILCGFVINRKRVICHRFDHSNIDDLSYMPTANLPLLYWINAFNGYPGGAKYMNVICAEVTSEGGVSDDVGVPFHASNGVATRSVTTVLPVISIRPLDVFNALKNRSEIIPKAVSVFSKDENVYVQLVWGATVTGGAWSQVEARNGIEVNTTATSITGGIVIGGGEVAATSTGAVKVSSVGQLSSNLLSKLPLALLYDGTHPTVATHGFADTLTILVTSIPGGATLCIGNIDGVELR